MPSYVLGPLCAISVPLIGCVVVSLWHGTTNAVWTWIGFLVTLAFCIGIQMYAGQLHPSWVSSDVGGNFWLIAYDIGIGFCTSIGIIIGLTAYDRKPKK